MKLKASEIAFLAICLVCMVVGVAVSAKVRTADSDGVIDLSVPESSDTSYSVEILNSATAEDFMEISGIGQVKAADIIAFRDAIGGFKRVEQIKEVSGISDATYAKIIDHFFSEMPVETAVTTEAEPVAEPTTVTEEESSSESTTASQATKTAEKTEAPSATATPEPEKVMREVDINSATAEELAEALLIDMELAESIISLREQIHYFSSVTELYLVDGMNGELYRRIENYIVVG